MKVVSFNVNGIRAAVKKGFIQWIEEAQPDVVCIQEVRAKTHEIPVPDGYQLFHNAAEKAGYAGTCILSKIDAELVTDVGMHHEIADREGRYVEVELANGFHVASAYVPTGYKSAEDKINFLAGLQNHIADLVAKDVIICGDFNLCLAPKDMCYSIRNRTDCDVKAAMLLGVDWFKARVEEGWDDVHRRLDNSPSVYTWWDYRTKARETNKGCRLDYHLASPSAADKAKTLEIPYDLVLSDHAPVIIEYVTDH